MDSGVPSFKPSHEASSPGPMRCCVFCHKPFLNETSYNRHVLYCRRAHSRPRTRVRSCRACSIAKAKCSFQPRCLRCTNKGLECVYGTTTATATAKRGQQVAEEHPSTSLTGGDFTVDDLFASSGAADMGEAPVDLDWEALGFAAADILPPTPKNNLPCFHKPAPKIIPDEPFLLSNPEGHYTNFNPENVSLIKLPGPTWNTQDENFPTLSKPISPSERPDSGFLARLPVLDHVSHFTATTVMEMLLAFPQMMLRRETFPSFIHGHWYRPSSAIGLSLPEPLANCIGIAQVFASYNPESKPFLWRAIKMEQRSFIEKRDQHQFSKVDLLAAIQAQIVYIIMRVHDNSKIEPDLNLEMLVTYQVLCESFRKLCNEPFAQDERLYISSTWEDWVLAESRRRTVLVWFLIAQTIHIKTGLSCDIIDGFRALPLPSPKSLWEARTRSAWQLEYKAYKSMPRIGLDVFGDLIDACKQSDIGSNRLKLNTWNAQADNLGILLSLSSTMI